MSLLLATLTLLIYTALVSFFITLDSILDAIDKYLKYEYKSSISKIVIAHIGLATTSLCVLMASEVWSML